MKLIFAAGLFAAASAAAFAQAPAGSTAQNQNATTPPSQQRSSGQSSQNGAQPREGEQTLTGCLTAAENIYTLTILDDSGGTGTTATTTAYTLLPGTGVDLKPFVNKRVTVKGAEAGPGMQNSARVVQRSGDTPAPTGTSGSTAAGTASGANTGSAAGNTNTATGSDQPKVQTEAKARINARTLNVNDVQPASGSCGAQ